MASNKTPIGHGLRSAVVGVDDIQTLTNKTLGSPIVDGGTITGASIVDATITGWTGVITDSTTSIVDDVDPTKVLKFELSSFTTETTNTITVPDSSDTMVLLAESQALTGKTVNGLTVTATTGTLTIPDGVVVTGPAASGTIATVGGTETLTAKTFTSPTINTPTLTAPVGTGFVISKTISFTENATATTHTGTVVLPAGSTLHNVQIVNTALWTGGTATLDVGDPDDPDGWFAGIDMKATDLVIGEVLSITSSETWGGKQGAYLDAATGKKGPLGTAGNSGPYSGVAKSVIAVITVGTPATTVGRSFMTVTYSVGAVTAATAA